MVFILLTRFIYVSRVNIYNNLWINLMESFTKHIRTTPSTWWRLKKTAEDNHENIGHILEEIMTGQRNPISMKLNPRRPSNGI